MLTVRSPAPSRELAGRVTLGTSWTSLRRSSHLSPSLYPGLIKVMDFDWTLIGVFQGGASEERSACSGKWPLVLPSALPWHVHPVLEMEWGALDCVQLWSRGGARRPSDQLWFKAVDVDLAQKQLSTWGTS